MDFVKTNSANLFEDQSMAKSDKNTMNILKAVDLKWFINDRELQ